MRRSDWLLIVVCVIVFGTILLVACVGEPVVKPG
jgi:hypothetical protein